MTNELNRGTPSPVRLSIPSNRAAQGGATTRLTVAGNRKFESISLHRRVSCKPDFLALSAPSRSRSSSSDNCACVRTSGFCHFRDLLEDGIGDPADQVGHHAHRQGAGRGARSLNKV